MANTGNLPEGALLEILLRLPVKSMFRFRCVSKSWFALLKSPHFIDMHLKFSLARDDENLLITRFLKEEKRNLLSIHSDDELLSVLVPNLELQGFSDESLSFNGSCNGIVCFSSRRDTVLLNPAIYQLRTLPAIPRLADCSFNINGMGFGFDPASKDYKVVQIISIDEDFNLYPDFCKAEIYTLSTDTWRELDVVLPRVMYGSVGLFLNGRIHWHAVDDANAECILSMDISTEVFHTFRFPEADETIMDISDLSKLSLMHDSLALILYSHRYPYPPHPDFEQSINIWLMKEYGVRESWSKQYSIGPLFGILQPISVWKNKRLLLESVCNRWRINAGRFYDDPVLARWTACSYEYECELVGWDVLNSQQVQKYNVRGFEHTMGVVFYKETMVSIVRT